MEIDHRLLVSDSNDLVTYDKEEVKAKVMLWLDTPKGSRWGDASWGHRLTRFKHEPLGSSLEVLMENTLFADLSRDIPRIKFSGLRIEVIDKDRFRLFLNTHAGLIDITTNRAI